MKLQTDNYKNHVANWPGEGRHILAQYDADSIVVYQAYRPEIGHFAATQGYFGGAFSLNRMSWIKPNFLWMMYRSGWGTKQGQEVTLAVRMCRAGFNAILAQAVPSTYWPEQYDTPEQWKATGVASDVRLQWDPDHDPYGEKLERRAIQLGLRGDTLTSYAREWILEIEDVSEFVAEQRVLVETSKLDHLLTPTEAVYPVDNDVAIRIGLVSIGGAL